MIKEVEINGKKYMLKSSVGTMKDYQKEFNKNYTDVISNFTRVSQNAKKLSQEDQVNYWLTKLPKLNEDVMALAYVMILEAKQKGLNEEFNYDSFDEWLRSMDNIDTNSFMGVLAVASAVFQRSLHNQ